MMEHEVEGANLRSAMSRKEKLQAVRNLSKELDDHYTPDRINAQLKEWSQEML